jgi:MFS transporter, DHA3 family, tetracycline resistance protein
LNRLDALRLYFIMSGGNAVLRSSMYLVLTLYYVLTVRMNPLELILAGTMLEVTYFLFQTPTGIFADLVSRRLSIVAGWAIAGACFTLEGLVPNVATILAAQAILGMGEACIDGAESAWLADELGPDLLGRAMVRGSKIAQIASILGIGVAAALGTIHLSLPVTVGGVGMVGMSIYFAFGMPEEGFKPARMPRTPHWKAAKNMMSGAVHLVRGNTVLLTVLGTELFFGGGSEGFDRLWEAHVVRDIGLPHVGGLAPVAWFALLAIAGSVVSYAASWYLEPRIDRFTANARLVARTLAVLNLGYVGVTVAFALSGNFILASLLLLVRSAILTPSSILRGLWMNRSINDSSVRATVLSMGGQCNALGQWLGGPLVGVLGTTVTLRAAIAVTGLVPAPVSLLYERAARAEVDTELPAAFPQEVVALNS